MIPEAHRIHQGRLSPAPREQQPRAREARKPPAKLDTPPWEPPRKTPFMPSMLPSLLLLASLASSAAGQTPPVTGTEGPSPAQLDTGVKLPVSQDRPAQLPGLFLDNTKCVFTAPFSWEKSDWFQFGLATAAVIGTALILDKPVHEAVVRHQGQGWEPKLQKFEPIGNKVALGTAAGFYLVGWLGEKEGARAAGADALSASLASSLMVSGLKYTLGRARPNEDHGPAFFSPFSGHESHPSGHTTQAFTVASVLAAHYPDTWVQITCYGLATLGGLSRIGQDAHWTSDVLAGALIGTAVGRGVTRMNQRRRSTQPGKVQVTLGPNLRPGYQGLQVALKF